MIFWGRFENNRHPRVTNYLFLQGISGQHFIANISIENIVY